MQGNTATLAIVIILACGIGVYGLFSVVSRIRKRSNYMLPASPMLARGSLESSPFSPAPHTEEITENIGTHTAAGATSKPPERTDTILSVDSLGLSPPSQQADRPEVRCDMAASHFVTQPTH